MAAATTASTSITVRVQAKGGKTVTLGFPGKVPSLFTGSWTLPAGSSGFFQAVITAVQRSTGNTGTGTVTFFVKQAS
jgi:hypothetical protein